MNYKNIKNKNDMEQIINTPLMFGQGIVTDALTNGWEITFSDAFKKSLSKIDVKIFIERIITIKQIYIKNNNIHKPVLFYLWHDMQVGHLCFSFIQGNKNQLPFGASLIFVNDMESIINAFLQDSIQNGCILKSEIIDCTIDFMKDFILEDEDYIVRVYCQFI